MIGPGRALHFVVLAAWLAVPRSASAETLRVFAASSLTESFQVIAADFEAAHPGTSVELQFAGSQVLRAQIEQGAPADVFAAADVAQMDPLSKAGLVRDAKVFAHNTLVAIASTKSGRVRSLTDLAKPKMRVVLAAETVPAGRYAVQCLARMNAAQLWGDDFQARVTANVVSRETNVRAVVAKVSLGEADAGIVYRTDVGAAEEILAIEIPERVNVIATYPIAVVSGTNLSELSEAFVALVTGDAGRGILRRNGFRT